MNLDIKIGDAVTSDTGTEWRVEGLPGISLAWPKDYLATSADGAEGMLSPSEITHINGKPVRPKDWEGGLPPAGTVCELRTKTGGWGEAEIKYISPTACVWLWQRGDGGEQTVEWMEVPYKMEFRAIRTQEQIEAEERQQAVDEMWSVYWQPEMKTAKEALGLLYDAGYRKPS